MNTKDGTTLQRAIQLMENGDFSTTVDILQEFLENNPTSLEGWYNLGYALSEIDKEEDAIKAYDEALAIDNMIFEIWFNKANVLYNLGDFGKARECYERAVELNPDDAEAWNNLGNCYSRLTEGEKAIEAYTRAVAAKPDYAEAYYNKANAHFIEEQDEQAIVYAETAVRLKPILGKLVDEWIQVARDRLAAREAEKIHREKQKILSRISDENEPDD